MDTSNKSTRTCCEKWTDGSGGDCAQSCANGKGGEVEAVAGIITDGEIDTLTPLGSSAWKRPKHGNKPASDREQNADWKAGCGKSARLVWWEGRGVVSPLLPQSGARRGFRRGDLSPTPSAKHHFWRDDLCWPAATLRVVLSNKLSRFARLCRPPRAVPSTPSVCGPDGAGPSKAQVANARDSTRGGDLD